MPAYLVRIIETRDLVGIFVADDEDDLEIVVDECTDVPECEYAELPGGGVMWESPAKPVPLDPGDPEDDTSPVEEFPWAGASLTEAWWFVVYGRAEVEWTPFEADPPRPSPPVPRRKPSGPGRVIQFRKRDKSL